MADWASVAKSAVGPIVGSGITFWATRSSDRERLSAAIIWMDGFDHHEEYVNLARPPHPQPVQAGNYDRHH